MRSSRRRPALLYDVTAAAAGGGGWPGCPWPSVSSSCRVAAASATGAGTSIPAAAGAALTQVPGGGEMGTEGRREGGGAKPRRAAEKSPRAAR